MKIGILALQGAVEPHGRKLESLGVEPVAVRRPRDLEGLAGIILPGGESTTMLHLLKLNDLWEPLKEFVRRAPTWGVCAGTILLAKKVSHPAQASLEVLDIDVERNAYGRQINSFIDVVEPTQGSPLPKLEGVFIRAPKIREVYGQARVLLNWDEEPVLVEQNHLLASTFHPELSEKSFVHEYFLNKAKVHRG